MSVDDNGHISILLFKIHCTNVAGVFNFAHLGHSPRIDPRYGPAKPYGLWHTAPNIITLGLNSLPLPRMLMGVSRVLLPSCAIHRANPLTSLATKTTGCAPRRLELLHNYGSTEYFIVG